MASQGISDSRAFDVSSEGQRLHITVRKEFDFGILSQDWAHSLVVSYPGPYGRVTFDMGLIGLVSSTFFAGLIKVHQHYCPKGATAITLVRPDPRVVRNLHILRLDKMFVIEPRPA